MIFEKEPIIIVEGGCGKAFQIVGMQRLWEMLIIFQEEDWSRERAREW